MDRDKVETSNPSVQEGLEKKRKLASSKDIEVESSVAPTQVKAKAFTSAVWQHFDKVMDGKKFLHSLCKYCKKQYAGSTSTATLQNHLYKCKDYPYNNAKKNQKTLEVYNAREGESKLMPWKFDQGECRDAIAKMIIMDELPFSFIERPGFKYFISVAVPRLQLVSRNTIAKDCMKLYADLKRELKNGLAFHAHRICLTTDTWTSLQNLSYMVLTAHFIDQNWKLHKRILNFSVVSSHKGVAIGQEIEACMLDWGIEKVFTLTVDNASSNDTAIAYLKKKLSKKDAFVLQGEFFHMRCCAHILNLIVRDGIKEVDESISRIRSAVRYIRSSPQRANQFKVCCEQEKISYKSNLVLDAPTRWNYTYIMLETALKFRKAFDNLDLETNFASDLPNGAPTDSDWFQAKTLCKFLKTFYDITKRLSGSLYVTASSYFHDVFLIEKSLISWANSSEDLNLKDMAQSMQQKFDKYRGDRSKINMMLLLAVVLDPRFKLNYVKFCYGSIYKKEKMDELEKNLKNLMFRMYACYELIEKNSQPKVAESSIGIEVDQVCDSQCEDDIMDMQNAYYKHLEDENVGAKSEIDRYLDETVEKKGDGSFDILSWWKLNAHRYRVLSLIAKDVLAILVSTVASESAFSTGGRVLDQFRSSLTPKIVECLICSQDWLRASRLPIDVEMRLEDMTEIESTLAQESDLVSPPH